MIEPLPNDRATVDFTDEEKRSILALRAGRLKDQPSTGAEETPFWAAEFLVGDERYALPLDALRACLPLRRVTPVPLSPPQVVGIVRFMGEILTTYSFSALLGGSGWRVDPSVLLVLDIGSEERVAVDCEQIPTPLALPALVVNRARTESDGAWAEVAIVGQPLVRVIDPAKLFLFGGKVARGG